MDKFILGGDLEEKKCKYCGGLMKTIGKEIIK